MVGLGAALAVLAVASAAFACTSTVGQITMQGVNGTTINGTTGSVTYQGDGGDFSQASKGYCNNGFPSSRLAVDTTTNVNPLKVEDFKLTVAPYQCPATPTLVDRIKPGTWEVRWVKAGAAIETDGSEYPVCHFNVDNPRTTTEDPDSRWVVLGTMNINNGSGSGEYALPSAMVGPGNICLERSIISQGDYATAPPVIFINKVNLI